MSKLALDEIFYQYLGGTPDEDEAEAWVEFKQDLTTLIAKEIAEVIGLNDGQQLAPRTMKPYKNQRNRDAKVRDSLRVEQRQRAKERGLL